MSVPVPDHRSFWGKARPDAPPPYPRYHPLAYHLLDVAAVVEALLDARPLALARAAALLGAPPTEARRLLATLAGLHDLGKASHVFQWKVPLLVPPPFAELGGTARLRGVHTTDGLLLWSKALRGWVPETVWPGAGEALDVLAVAVFGHHGEPVEVRRERLQDRFQGGGREIAEGCARAVVAALCPVPLSAPPLPEGRASVASWWVAGLLTVADWVGSQQQWFRYTAPLADDPTLAGYLEVARDAARRAVREAGLATPRPAPRRSFAELVKLDAPSPLQRWSDAVELPAAPWLVVVEDVTGAGKTEAAQLLVHRAMARGDAVGPFWALPTQATANAMYDRQAAMLGGLFVEGEEPRPSLVLAHGKRRLHPGFRATVLDGVADASREDGEPADALPAGASCAAFLADDRRASLLADVGAGTVDQALLGVLAARFGTVRLFGLADHVLVVDEAHAYDAYMGQELQGLLRFHAALGGCAVVLSATLSRRERGELVDAWRDGLAAGGWEAPDASLASDAYPLATVVSPAGVREEPCAAAAWSAREVAVRLIHTVDDALEHLERTAGAGGAAVWIRNTVDDCLEAAARLRARGAEKVMVFHARFAQKDRQDRETEVMARFGARSTREDRSGWILIATQVVEQSLDLDFDAMVSDLAPVDLLIQRVGRLWRHPRSWRPPEQDRAELLVLAPDPEDESLEGWTKGLFAGTAAVYRHVGVLWRTVRVLRREGAVRTPEGLRGLIEAVYAEGAEEPPPELAKLVAEAEGREMGHATVARYSVLDVRRGYDRFDAWATDLEVRTRLGEDRTVVRLARLREDGALEPWAGEPEPWRAWALSEIAVGKHLIPGGSREPDAIAAAAETARATWGRWEREIPVLAMAEVEGVLRGELRRPDGSVAVFRYSVTAGLASERMRGGRGPDAE